MRNEGVNALIRGEGDANLFGDVASMNGELDSVSSTVALFERVRSTDPQLAKECYRYAEEALIAQRRYDLCADYLSDPIERFEAGVERRRKHAEFASDDELLKQAVEWGFTHQTCRLIELLVGLNRTGEAREIKRRALLVRDDPEMRMGIEDAMRRPTEMRE